MTWLRLPHLVVLIAVMACGTAAPAAAQQLATLRVQTVPPLRGIPIAVDGQVLRTDGRGAAELLVEVPIVGNAASLRGVAESLTVRSANVGPRTHVRLGRWYAIGGWRRPLADRYVLHAALDVSYAVTPRFVEPSGRAVDRARVSSVVVRSSYGTLHAFKGTEDLRLRGTRVARVGSTLRAKDIRYGVQRVVVDGANVVNRGRLRFRPRRTRELPMELRFYPATFVVRDALFGFSAGSAIRLRFPDGRVERHELGSDGEVRLASLPRGDYEVEAEAPGVFSKTPVSLSRPQEIELKVLSYLDLAVAVLVLLAVAGLLLLAGRPNRVPIRMRLLSHGRPISLRGKRSAKPSPVVHWTFLSSGRPVRLVDFFDEDDKAALIDRERAVQSSDVAPAQHGAPDSSDPAPAHHWTLLSNGRPVQIVDFLDTDYKAAPGNGERVAHSSNPTPSRRP